jgi:hypothetical protein
VLPPGRKALWAEARAWSLSYRLVRNAFLVNDNYVISLIFSPEKNVLFAKMI